MITWKKRLEVQKGVKYAATCMGVWINLQLFCKLFVQLMWNLMKIFEKPFIFYSNPEFPWKDFKIRFLGLLFRSRFLGFLDTCTTFSAVCKKKIG